MLTTSVTKHLFLSENTRFSRNSLCIRFILTKNHQVLGEFEHHNLVETKVFL
ncbi:hypothetical protein Hanom_Chr07g00624181 [Helianthus anomalus]